MKTTTPVSPFPIIKLREPEKIWLNAVYDKILKNEKPSYKTLKAELLDKIPVNFNPQTIDNRLCRSNGEDITMLGIWTIDPKAKIIEKTNKVIKTIQSILRTTPEVTDFESKVIANKARLKESEVGLILDIIRPYGTFWRSGNQSTDYYGLSSIRIGDEKEIFDRYLTFISIEKLIKTYHKEEEEQAEQFKKLETKKTKKEAEEIPKADTFITFKPIFTSRISQIDPRLCFVLMPFTEEWSERIFTKYIRETIEGMHFQCLRADNLKGPIIIEDIWTKINQAAFIIADVTGKNPNVMYELGIAHTIGKPVILITQDVKNIPFDFTHLRHYAYKDNSDGKEQFCKQLQEIVSVIYKEIYPGFQE